MNSRPLLLALALAVALGAQAPARPDPGGFTLHQVMGFPFPSSLVASSRGEHIAWTTDRRGVRNVIVADGPALRPIPLTHYTLDDGQPISALQITPNGRTVVYVRGSEWNALGDAADPDNSAVQPQQQVWSVRRGHAPVLLGDMGCSSDACADVAMSPDGKWVVWPTRNLLWIAPTSGRQPVRLFAWAQGRNLDPVWSPDSRRIAFVSVRPGHSLIGVYTLGGAYVHYLAPSVDLDSFPRWSPDGSQIVFIRQRLTLPLLPPPDGPEPADLEPGPIPVVHLPQWELWVADAQTFTAHRFWESGTRPQDALYRTTMHAALQVGAHHEVLFSSEADGWNHLYSVSDVTAGGQINTAKLLTPGAYEIKAVTLLPGKTAVVYNSNENDVDRRHLWRVPLDGSRVPVAITRGASIEWSPVETGDGRRLVCLGSTATTPPMPYRIGADGERTMIGALPVHFPAQQLVTPTQVIFPSTDGLHIHGQLFRPPGAGSKPLPTIVFVHGGPQRQMMLGFHPMDYYAYAYAENEYLTRLGFNVLSVNYRSGIMYGRAFRMAPHTGPHGGKEYDDVVAANQYLRTLPFVDPHRIGIWGGSWGGYLTAMALSHNSDLFAAGVDFHGVEDWSTDYSHGGPPPPPWGYDHPWKFGEPLPGHRGNLAFDSSPDAYVANWRAPVLLIQGDDDREVAFEQMIGLVERLRSARVPFEQLVFPGEVHVFLRWSTWIRSYAATADFFQRVLQEGQKISTHH